MLARVAENLYWMGRYLERVEFRTRYYVVQYFSTLEKPMTENKDYTLRSILYMSGTQMENDISLDENEVMRKVFFDANDPSSMCNLIKKIRENGREIRNNISIELWESINKWHLFCQDNTDLVFSSNDFYTFYESMRFHIAMIKSNMVHTLLHKDVWHFLNIGVYLERSLQVTSILKSKISDYTILSQNGENEIIKVYEMNTLLHCLEAQDIHQVQYRGQKMTQATIFQLVISNPDFPRAINYTMRKCHQHLKKVSARPHRYDEVTSSFQEVLDQCHSFNEFDNESAVTTHLDNITNWTTNIDNKISKLFFH